MQEKVFIVESIKLALIDHTKTVYSPKVPDGWHSLTTDAIRSVVVWLSALKSSTCG